MPRQSERPSFDDEATLLALDTLPDLEKRATTPHSFQSDSKVPFIKDHDAYQESSTPSPKPSWWRTKGAFIALFILVGTGVGLGVGIYFFNRQSKDSEGTTAIGDNPFVPGGSGPNGTSTTTNNVTIPDLYAKGSPIGEGSYYMRPIHSGLALGWESDTQLIVQSNVSVSGLPSQVWVVENAGDGLAYIKSGEIGAYTWLVDQGNAEYVHTTTDKTQAYKWKISEDKNHNGISAYHILKADNGVWDVEQGSTTDRAQIILFYNNNGDNQRYSFEPVGTGLQAGTYTIALSSSGQQVVTDHDFNLHYTRTTTGDTWRVIPVDTGRVWIYNLVINRWLVLGDFDAGTGTAIAEAGSSPQDLWLSGATGRTMICQANASEPHCLTSGADASGALTFTKVAGNGTMNQWFTFAFASWTS